MNVLWMGLCGVFLLLLLVGRCYAYPEIHYRFAPGLSRLYRRYPEILFDVPWRVIRGEPLPVVLLIRHADRFPVQLFDIRIQIRDSTGRIRQPKIEALEWPARVDDPLWWNLWVADTSDLPPGKTEVICAIRYRAGRRIYESVTDNLPGLSHAPLVCMLAEEPLPRFEGWHHGEPHCHSDKTLDQIEFGPPVPVIAQMAEAIGLDWVAITDHSYDLDVPRFDHFGQDPTGERWRLLGEEVNRWKGETLLIRGEEISCGNAEGRNVHLLLYDHPELFPGRGDGGKRGLNLDNAPDLSLREVLARASEAVSFAAHPAHESSRLERLLLNRGEWLPADLPLPDGLQIWNTYPGAELDRGIEQWRTLLLEGRRVPILAGSDAHGDFSRTRQARLPFLKLADAAGRFGVPRTCAFVRRLDRPALLDALKQGRSVVTDGPLVGCTVSTNAPLETAIGGVLSGASCQLRIRAKSTSEFGMLEHLRLYRGFLGGEEFQQELPLSRGYDFETVYSLEVNRPGYVRLEAQARKGDHQTRCLTNPIWLEPSRSESGDIS